MLVYKYRYGNKETIERDIHTINSNCYWAAKIDSLNDPCETLINSNQLNKELGLIGLFLENNIQRNSLKRVKEKSDDLLNHYKEYVGIYSLSKTYLDEILWAHYANSHSGFCIEYDLQKLLSEEKVSKAKAIDVIYQEKPPNFQALNLSGKYEDFVKLIGGYKSTRWEYEKELRIITQISGSIFYNPEALVGIYFGLRMPKSEKDKLFKALRNRKIKYYQIQQLENSYTFKREEIENPYKSEQKYLSEIPYHIRGKKINTYIITKKEYYNDFEKGRIEVMFERKPKYNEIEWLANDLKKSLFKKASKLIMFYKFKQQTEKGVAYAFSHYEKEKGFEIKINEFVE